MLENIINNVKPKAEKILEALQEEFRTLHTGKASSSLVEDILVEYFGTKVPLKQMAQINTPQANQILIIPFDKNSSKDIETSIRNSDLGLSPVGEGTQIRLILPPLSEERRRELTKVIKKKAELAKVSIRNIRRLAWDEVQKAEKTHDLTEDDKYSGQEQLNKIVENYNNKIDQLTEIKEAEIMKV